MIFLTRASRIAVLSAAPLLLLSAGLPAAQAQDWAKAKLDASTRHGEYVTISEPDGRKLQAWVMYPERKDKAPVVILIHEIFGMSDWTRLMADELAAKGYLVVEPDLLSGFGPPSAAAPAPAMADMPGMDHAHPQQAAGGAFVAATPGGTSAFPDQSATVKAISALDPAGVLRDLDAAADYGEKLPSAAGELFVAGFCWGGGKSFAFATHRPELRAAFVFYGPPPPSADMAAIHAPVEGFYAGNDARIDATLPQTVIDMKTAGRKFDPVTYDGAGHGFMRAGQAPGARPEDVKAWEEGFARMLKEMGKAS